MISACSPMPLALAPGTEPAQDGGVFGQYHPFLPARRPAGQCQQDRDGILGGTHHIHRLRPPTPTRRDHPGRIRPARQRRTQARAQHGAIRALLCTGQSRERVRCLFGRVWEPVVHPVQSCLVGQSDAGRRGKSRLYLATRSTSDDAVLHVLRRRLARSCWRLRSAPVRTGTTGQTRCNSRRVSGSCWQMFLRGATPHRS